MALVGRRDGRKFGWVRQLGYVGHGESYLEHFFHR